MTLGINKLMEGLKQVYKSFSKFNKEDSKTLNLIER